MFELLGWGIAFLTACGLWLVFFGLVFVWTYFDEAVPLVAFLIFLFLALAFTWWVWTGVPFEVRLK